MTSLLSKSDFEAANQTLREMPEAFYDLLIEGAQKFLTECGLNETSINANFAASLAVEYLHMQIRKATDSRSSTVAELTQIAETPSTVVVYALQNMSAALITFKPELLPYLIRHGQQAEQHQIA